jgi:hypothetical protein
LRNDFTISEKMRLFLFVQVCFSWRVCGVEVNGIRFQVGARVLCRAGSARGSGERIKICAWSDALWQAEFLSLLEWRAVMQKRSWREWLVVAVALAVPGMALSQGGDETRSLAINGLTGQAPVVRMQGKSYVELEALARLTHGSLSYEGSQATLTFPGFPATTATTPSGEKSEFSKEFLRAGIEEMAMVREWRIALTNAVQNGFAVGDDWIALFRGPALRNLRLASVAASTDADRSAYQLLSNEYDNIKKLSDQFVAAHTAQEYTPPDALKSNPLNQKILDCARSLAAMAANGEFVDDGSCH